MRGKRWKTVRATGETHWSDVSYPRRETSYCKTPIYPRVSVISKLIYKFDIIRMKCPAYQNKNMKLVTKNRYMINAKMKNSKNIFLIGLTISKAI